LNENTSYFLSPFVKTINGVKYGESINILIPEKNPALIRDSLSMSVYPNPSDGDFTVSFEHNMPDVQKAQITVMDMYGKTIHSREIYLDNIFFQREEIIELSGPQVTTGIYFVHIHMGEIAETRKIMINR
jgi:hypothetical protein